MSLSRAESAVKNVAKYFAMSSDEYTPQLALTRQNVQIAILRGDVINYRPLNVYQQG